MVDDSFFVQELLNLKFDSNHLIMASFDITSLLTNIPVDETIDIVINHLVLNTTHYHGFSREQFKKLLHFSVKECHFLFNGSLYEQIVVLPWAPPLDRFSLIFFYHFMKEIGSTTVPLTLSPHIIDAMLMTVFYYFVLQVTSLYFLIS